MLIMRCVSGSARLFADTQGTSGSVVVLLHGLGGSRHAWCHIPRELSGSHRVITPDLRGCGDSDRGTEPYSFDLLAGDLLAILDALDVPLCHIVGHSLGGVLAQHLLTAHQDRCASAVLVSTSSRVGDKAAIAWRRLADIVETKGLSRSDLGTARGFADAFVEQHPDLLGILSEITSASDPKVYAEQARIAAAYDYTEALGTVRRPVLVLQGLADKMTSPGGSVLLSRAIPGSTLEMIEGVGHNLHLEMGEAFTRRLEQFFDLAGSAF
jgi:3-oxoadipate enol-lactonase